MPCLTKYTITKFKIALLKYTTLEDNVIVIDFRDLELIPMGNRFYEYIYFSRKGISRSYYLGERKA